VLSYRAKEAPREQQDWSKTTWRTWYTWC